MAQLTYLDFIAKWQLRFQPNTTFAIEEADFQEFAVDIADTFGVRSVNVLPYKAGTLYAEGNLVRYALANAPEAFYYALQAGQLPAPVAVGDVNWKVVPGPVPATQLGQYLPLVQAQNMNGDLVVLGRDYQIELPQLSASGHAQYLSVAGIAENWLASEGWLLVNNVRTKVKNIDFVAGTWEVDTRYTQSQVDKLLAAKQGAVTAQVDVAAYGPANSLLRSNFDQYVRLVTSQDAELNLPPCTLTDVGRILALHNYGGPGSDATQTLQATLGSDTSYTYITTLRRGYVALLEVVSLTRGTPFNDVVATYAVLANSLVEPGAPLPTVTPAQLATATTTLPVTATRSADYTLQLSDAGCLVPVASAGPVVVTVHTHATTPFPVGTTLYVSQDGPGQVSIAAAAGVVLQTADGYKISGQWQDVALHKRDLNTWVLKGGAS